MPQLSTRPGETLSQLADRVFNGDVSRFTELLDLNSTIDTFASDLLPDTVEIPDAAQVFQFARPQLSRISESIGGAGRFLEGVRSQLPAQLQGYADEAIEQIQSINEITAEVETAIDQAEDAIGQYEGQGVQLVQWLLGRR